MRIITITLETFADILEQATITQTITTGPTILHQGTHPEHGNMVLVNDASGNCALITA